MAQKGVNEQMVNQWVEHGAVIQQDENTFLYLTRDGVSVVSRSGQLITAYSKAYFKDHILAAIQQVYGK